MEQSRDEVLKGKLLKFWRHGETLQLFCANVQLCSNTLELSINSSYLDAAGESKIIVFFVAIFF